jgi:hypothetical protein
MMRVPLSWNFTLPTRFFSGKKYLLSAAVTSAVSLQDLDHAPRDTLCMHHHEEGC